MRRWAVQTPGANTLKLIETQSSVVSKSFSHTEVQVPETFNCSVLAQSYSTPGLREFAVTVTVHT